MNYLLAISIAGAFLLVGLIPASEQKPRRQRNRPPSIDHFISSLIRLEICPFLPTSVVSGQPQVNLVVNATDPDGDTLHYEYSVTEGTISGKGNSVIWNLRDLPRGAHEVRVTVTDGKGGKVQAALTVTTVDAVICDRPPPPCPVIKVTCADEMDKSKPFVFAALVEGEPKDYRPGTIRWKLNAGRIVRGQYSREIEATTTGANGFDNITATAELAGADPSCLTVASCTTKIIW